MFANPGIVPYLAFIALSPSAVDSLTILGFLGAASSLSSAFFIPFKVSVAASPLFTSVSLSCLFTLLDSPEIRSI